MENDTEEATMIHHLELARRLAHESDASVSDAARALGRTLNETGPRFYSEDPMPRAKEILAMPMPSIPCDIVDGFAASAWATAWMEAEEEKGITYPGQRIEDVLPTAPPEVEAETWLRLGQIEAATGKWLDDVMDTVIAADPAMDSEGESLGACIYHEFVGSGARWSDDHAAIPGFDVPVGEVSIESVNGFGDMTPEVAVRIAHAYASMMHAGDPGVVLYSFASRGGVVDDEAFRSRLLTHVRDEVLPAAVANDRAGDADPFHGNSEEEDVLGLIEFVSRIPALKPEATPAL